MRPGIALRILVPALAAALLLTARPSTAGELVPWSQEADFASSLARAKKEKKLVFVDFYAVWCGPCKMMDRVTYSDSAAAVEAGRFVSRKVDAEKGEGLALARRYKVTAYPTLLVVDADGKEVNRQVGFLPAERFTRFLEDTRTGRGTIEGLQALIAPGRAIPASSCARACSRLVEAALGAANQAAGQGEGELAVACTDLFLERFPDHPRRADLYAQKAAALASLDRNPDALDAFRHVVELRPGEPAVLATFARLAAMTGLALDEALERAQKAVELAPGQAFALDALGEVYAARGQWDDAVGAAEKALAARPGDGALRGKLERYQERAVEAAHPSGGH